MAIGNCCFFALFSNGKEITMRTQLLLFIVGIMFLSITGLSLAEIPGEYLVPVESAQTIIFGADPEGEVEIVGLVGTMLIREWPYTGYSRITLPDGRVQFEIEVVESYMSGYSEKLGGTIAKAGVSTGERGTVTQITAGVDFPAEVQLGRVVTFTTPFGILHHDGLIDVEAKIDRIPPVFDPASPDLNVFQATGTLLPLLDPFDETVGYIDLAACAVRITSAGIPTVSEWPVANGGNGHYYEVRRVTGSDNSWHAARLAAGASVFGAASGYLATITSQAENDFVVNLIQRQFPQSLAGSVKVWLGGYQQVPNGPPNAGWVWVTGEPWLYTNWLPGEANDHLGLPEDFLGMWIVEDPTFLGYWNDFINSPDPNSPGMYVVEWEIGSIPGDPIVSPGVWLGVGLDPNTTESMVVGSVVDGSPASIAGLKVGDLIIQVGERAVSGIEEFAPVLSELRPGTETSLQIVRDAEFQFISIVPTSLVFANQDIMSDPVMEAWCTNDCDCADHMLSAHCYVNYYYVGEGPNGGILYKILCVTISEVAGDFLRIERAGPFEFF
jgi:hypothetical protein